MLWNMQATIKHQQDQLAVYEEDRKALAVSRLREGELEKQVELLTQQLLEAKRHHTPVSHGPTLEAFLSTGLLPPNTQSFILHTLSGDAPFQLPPGPRLPPGTQAQGTREPGQEDG